MRAPSFAGQAGPCWHRRRRSLKPCTGMTARRRRLPSFHSASGRWSRRLRRHGASSSSAKAFRTKTEKEIEAIYRTTHWAGGLRPSRIVNATGMIAGSVRIVRPPKRIASSARSISGPNLVLPAGRFWNFMRATIIPAATDLGQRKGQTLAVSAAGAAHRPQDADQNCGRHLMRGDETTSGADNNQRRIFASSPTCRRACRRASWPCSASGWSSHS